jgi:hypothetical protein
MTYGRTQEQRGHTAFSTLPLSHFERSHIVILSAPILSFRAQREISLPIRLFQTFVAALTPSIPTRGSMSYAELTNAFKFVASASAVRRLQKSQPGSGLVFQIGSQSPNIQSANFTVRFERNERRYDSPSGGSRSGSRRYSRRSTVRKHRCWRRDSHRCRKTTTRPCSLDRWETLLRQSRVPASYSR